MNLGIGNLESQGHLAIWESWIFAVTVPPVVAPGSYRVVAQCSGEAEPVAYIPQPFEVSAGDSATLSVSPTEAPAGVDVVLDVSGTLCRGPAPEADVTVALAGSEEADEFVARMVDQLRLFGQAFAPRPIIYRSTDFRTNEFRHLQGAEPYEPREENPMIGFRGAFRYIQDPALFQLELQIIKQVREQWPNLQLMIPFVRTGSELRACKRLIDQSGLADQPGGMEGRAGGQLRALQQHDLAPAAFRQMIGDAAADDAAADDHRPGMRRQLGHGSPRLSSNAIHDRSIAARASSV